MNIMATYNTLSTISIPVNFMKSMYRNNVCAVGGVERYCACRGGWS